MKAPYLKIEGKKVDVGSFYYTVQTLNNYKISEHKAGNENIIIQEAYFLNRQDAERYSQMGILSKLLGEQIREIEKKHHGYHILNQI